MVHVFHTHTHTHTIVYIFFLMYRYGCTEGGTSTPHCISAHCISDEKVPGYDYKFHLHSCKFKILNCTPQTYGLLNDSTLPMPF